MQLTQLLIIGSHFVLLLSSSHAFTVTTGTPRRQVRLFGVTHNLHRNSNEGDDNSFDVEAARQKLESLVATEKQDPQRPHPLSSLLFSGPANTSAPIDLPQKMMEEIQLPPAPLLTTLERERRAAEMHVLARLEHGDEALGDLWTLWFQERGASAQARLMRAEELVGNGPSSWDEAEGVLCDLIDSYGVHWAEPVNRLATLYFMQGRLEESKALCKIVLAVKPWHFGALSGLVMVYASQHNVEEARRWAARRLPVFASEGHNRRRVEWVQKALADAQDSLHAAERHLAKSFGPSDDRSLLQSDADEFSSSDAWQ